MVWNAFQEKKIILFFRFIRTFIFTKIYTSILNGCRMCMHQYKVRKRHEITYVMIDRTIDRMRTNKNVYFTWAWVCQRIFCMKYGRSTLTFCYFTFFFFYCFVLLVVHFKTKWVLSKLQLRHHNVLDLLTLFTVKNTTPKQLHPTRFCTKLSSFTVNSFTAHNFFSATMYQFWILVLLLRLFPLFFFLSSSFQTVLEESTYVQF